MSICKCGVEIPNKTAIQCRKCWLSRPKPPILLCSVCGIKIRKTKYGKCRTCFYNHFKIPTPCKKCGKEKEYRGSSKDFCNSCYQKDNWDKNREEKNKYHMEYKRKKNGTPLDLPNMRDGKMGSVGFTGYKTVVAHGHPNAMGKKQRIFEHTLIMTDHLGRPLKKGESVHHLNGIRDDNRIENLELWDKSQPAGQRVKDKISFYKEFLEFHGYKIS